METVQSPANWASFNCYHSLLAYYSLEYSNKYIILMTRLFGFLLFFILQFLDMKEKTIHTMKQNIPATYITYLPRL